MNNNDVKLELVRKDEEDVETYDLKINGEKVARFWVEYTGNENALISYKTNLEYRNKGYASQGLKMLKEKLFLSKRIITLELINLSGEYSQKVAENAGFFSPTDNLDYYVTLNPMAQELVEKKISEGGQNNAKYEKLLDRIKRLKNQQKNSINRMKERLSGLEELMNIADENYKGMLKVKIAHLKRILNEEEREI